MILLHRYSTPSLTEGVCNDTEETPSYDDKATSNRHRKAILDYLGVRAFDEVAERELLKDIRSMVRSQLRPKFVLFQSVDRLQSRKTEISSSHTLTETISIESKRHGRELATMIDSGLSTDQRDFLDELMSKEDGPNTNQNTQRYKLTLLKRFTLSTEPVDLRPKFRQHKRLLVPAYKVRELPGLTSTLAR